jgi:hypothetical protein
MYPDKHVKEMENKVKAEKASKIIFELLVLFLSFYILAPLIHEFSHIIYLVLMECSHQVSWGAGFTGLTASVKPFCVINGSQALVFYLSGYVSTVLAGMSLSVRELGVETCSDYVKLVGTGLLASVIFTVGRKGDIRTLGHLLGISPDLVVVFKLLIVLSLSGFLLLSWMRYFRSEGE